MLFLPVLRPYPTVINPAKHTVLMANDGTKPNNALSPYYPSETPSIRGNSRKLFTILMLLTFLLSGILTIISIVV